MNRSVEIPLDGSTPRQLPANDPRSHWLVAYSPDGAHVAYSENSSLYVARADGSQARVLFAGRAEDAVWSPAGDRIAFDAASGGGMTNMGYTTQIHVVDVTSGKVTSLTGTGATHNVIGFSPGGEWVLFSRANANESAWSLWMVRTDGSEPQLLVKGTQGGEWQPMRVRGARPAGWSW